MKIQFIFLLIALLFVSISLEAAVPGTKFTSIGKLESNDPRFDQLVAPDAKIEKLAEGFVWTEGPVWSRKKQCLYFSDVPTNIVYQWTALEGANAFIVGSGYNGSTPRGGEPGSNGLTVDSKGRLVLCEHGNRRVSLMERNGGFTTLATFYQGRRFNSPNDLVFKSNGDLYFTDPPYGLEGNNQDPKKELSFNGVYRVNKKGEVTLLTSELSFPNGIAFSPDEKTLYVANSDPKRAIWMAYEVRPDGKLGKGRIFFDATSMVGDNKPGLPDGLKVDLAGNLFATGPGGVLVFSPDGKHLGTINTGVATANCAWGENGNMLYIAANHWLCRIKTKTKGKVP